MCSAFSVRSYLRAYLLISYEAIHQIMFSSFTLRSQAAEAKLNGTRRRHNLAQPKHKHTHTVYWFNEDSFTSTPSQQTDRGDAEKKRQIKNWKCQDWLDFHMSAVTHKLNRMLTETFTMLKLTGVSKWQTTGEKGSFLKGRRSIWL